MTRREQKPNLGRHKRNCSVCRHPKLSEIEADFISWSPAAIATEYGLADRTSVYRHAHFGLFPKRQRNVRAALEKRELTKFNTDAMADYRWDLSPDGTRIAILKRRGGRIQILWLNRPRTAE